MNDVSSLVVGSVAGAVVSELLRAVIEEAKMVVAFKSVSTELASKMNKVRLAFIEIETLQGGAEELKELKDIIIEARVLVRKCSKVKGWNLPAKAKYTRKVEVINKKLLEFCQIQLQLIIYRNQRLMMRKMGIHQCSGDGAELSARPYNLYDNLPEDKLMAIKSHLESIKKELEVLSVSPPDLFPVPKIDTLRRLFGLDLPLMEVKKKLLDDDDDPVASLVVSAPPGCGKTTLVTQLCHDDEIKGIKSFYFFTLEFRFLVSHVVSFYLICRKVRVYLLL